MSLTTKVGFLAGATVVTLSGSAFSGTSADVSYEDLQQRLDAAEAKITELSASQNAEWLTEQRAEQVRGLVQDVLADADTRASLQGSGMTAGYNNGFVVSSNDGNWMLRVNGLMQNRWTMASTNGSLNYAGTGPVATAASRAAGTAGTVDGRQNHHGFEMTRAALNFSGTVAKDYHFNMRLNWTPYNGNNSGTNGSNGNVAGPAELEWAYIQWDLSDQWDIQVGKQKHDVMHNYIVNAENQQAIERSLYTYYWQSSSITNGIKLNYDGDSIRANLMYSSGAANEDTGSILNGSYVGDTTEWNLSGRIAYLGAGTWDQFGEMTSPKGSESGWMLGFGWNVMQLDDDLLSGSGDRPSGSAVGPSFFDSPDTVWQITWDAAYDAGGWNVYGSMSYGTDGNRNAMSVENFQTAAAAGTLIAGRAARPSDFSPQGHQWGWEVGAGYYLQDDWEAYIRFEWLDPRIRTAVSDEHNNIEILTIGTNWYLSGNNAKLSLDWGYNFDATQTTMIGGSGYTDWLTSSTGNEWVLRTQLQLYF